MSYCVYLLRSEKDKNHYIGQTNNIEKRLREHNFGLVNSTKNRRPFSLIGYEVYGTRNKARWKEYQLKKHGDQKRKFIKKLEMASGS